MSNIFISKTYFKNTTYIIQIFQIISKMQIFKKISCLKIKNDFFENNLEDLNDSIFLLLSDDEKLISIYEIATELIKKFSNDESINIDMDLISEISGKNPLEIIRDMVDDSEKITRIDYLYELILSNMKKSSCICVAFEYLNLIKNSDCIEYAKNRGGVIQTIIGKDFGDFKLKSLRDLFTWMLSQ